jgi:serine/threonine protein kinase
MGIREVLSSPRSPWQRAYVERVIGSIRREWELAGQSLGGYLLEEEIGRGSMGMVYRGRQIALGREVAIKVLPRALAR